MCPLLSIPAMLPCTGHHHESFVSGQKLVSCPSSSGLLSWLQPEGGCRIELPCHLEPSRAPCSFLEKVQKGSHNPFGSCCFPVLCPPAPNSSPQLQPCRHSSREFLTAQYYYTTPFQGHYFAKFSQYLCKRDITVPIFKMKQLKEAKVTCLESSGLLV